MAAFLNLYDGTTRKRGVYENPFELSGRDNVDVELRKRFRFDQRTIIDLTDLIRADFERETQRGHPLLPETKVMIALRYLASNSHQQTIADMFRVSQKAVSTKKVRRKC